MPSSFMTNIIKSVDLPPICGPKLAPETEGRRRAPARARPAGSYTITVLPPTRNAPFTSFGITATNLAP